MSIVVVYDACVLCPAPLRDLLIRLATKRLFQAKWTETILDEVFRNILKERPELEAKRLDRTRRLLNAAVPDSLVRGYERRISGLSLPDPDDRHVLAAAIHAKARVIVTANLRDFPDRSFRIAVLLVTESGRSIPTNSSWVCSNLLRRSLSRPSRSRQPRSRTRHRRLSSY